MSLLSRSLKLATQRSEQQRERERGRTRPAEHITVAMRSFATARQLSNTGDLDHPGFLAALPVDVRQRFNVLRGTLPGGGDGVLFQHLNLARRPGPQGVGHRIVAEPGTTAAVRVPEAVGVLLRFEIGREVTPADRYWRNESLPIPGFDGWKLAMAPAAYRGVLDPLLGTAVAEVVSGMSESLKIIFGAGCLSVRQDGYLATPTELDVLANQASRLAAAVRTACGRGSAALAFSSALPPPAGPDPADEPRLRIDGAQTARVYRGDHIADVVIEPGLDVPPDEPVRAWIDGVAATRGLVAEDPLAFHRAFPKVSRCGQAFAVFRGPLPGTGVHGRLVGYAERQLQLPHSGVNAALLPVAAGVADGPTQPVGEGLAAGVRGGVLNVSRLRLEPGLVGEAFDRLAMEAVEIGRSWGVLDETVIQRRKESS